VGVGGLADGGKLCMAKLSRVWRGESTFERTFGPNCAR